MAATTWSRTRTRFTRLNWLVRLLALAVAASLLFGLALIGEGVYEKLTSAAPFAPAPSVAPSDAPAPAPASDRDGDRRLATVREPAGVVAPLEEADPLKLRPRQAPRHRT